jgi:hypothetical protein
MFCQQVYYYYKSPYGLLYARYEYIRDAFDVGEVFVEFSLKGNIDWDAN